MEEAAQAAYWKTRTCAEHGEQQFALCRASDYSDEWPSAGGQAARCY